MEQSLHIQTSMRATTLQFFDVPLKVKVRVDSLVLMYYTRYVCFNLDDMKFKAETQVVKNECLLPF